MVVTRDGSKGRDMRNVVVVLTIILIVVMVLIDNNETKQKTKKDIVNLKSLKIAKYSKNLFFWNG